MQNIVDALQKEGVKKTAVERSLAALVEKGQVHKKEYGKAKIFILDQSHLELPDADDIAETDARLRTLTETLQSVQQRLGSKRERVAELRAQLTLEEAQEKVRNLQDDLTTKRARRERLGDGSALMSKEDKVGIDKEYGSMRTAWKKYSRMVKEIIDQIGEATGKTKKDLYEEVGVETDEEVKVNICDFPEVTVAKRGSGGAGRSDSAKRQRLS